MSCLPNSLVFGEVSLSIIGRNGAPWLQARDVGRALGYSRENSIHRIYDRNQDEFTKGMTCVVNLTTQGQTRAIRIFSPRGCHLLAMFARTPRAKQFRRWVLDVLDVLGTKCATKAVPDAQKTLKSRYWDLGCELHSQAHKAMRKFQARMNKEICDIADTIMARYTDTPERRSRMRVIQMVHASINRTSDAIDKELEVMINIARGIEGIKDLSLR